MYRALALRQRKKKQLKNSPCFFLFFLPTQHTTFILITCVLRLRLKVIIEVQALSSTESAFIELEQKH